ncbi:hypothetical protein SLU01_30580 [Sporosarcina luteola]|uniref:Uncharacterized protein n=1 Tax=Sporosarcina luteola TaxID=582850 RepID=A0A511ZBC6_9BACL|nr:hypothetical protein SLU01_30580 [Sporosarcina luteola]
MHLSLTDKFVNLTDIPTPTSKSHFITLGPPEFSVEQQLSVDASFTKRQFYG